MAEKTKDAAEMWGRIDRLRMEREWTWRELSRRAGLKNQTQLLASKSAVATLRSDTLGAVAEALGTSSDYLRTGVGSQVAAPAPPKTERADLLATFVEDVERSKIAEWAASQPVETRPSMVEIAKAMELVHVEVSASGGIFYSTSDGVPVRDWGAFFEALRDGRLGSTLSDAAAKVRGGPLAKKR